MFWTEDINELFKPILIPTEYMTIEEKFNSITRLVLFICIILALVFQDSRIILLMIILLLIIIIIYQFQKQSTRDAYKVLEANDVKVVDNEVCTKPSIHNPFMNPNIVNLNQYKACPITDRKTIEEAEKLFDDTMFRNVDDVYDKNTGKRHFYTVPVTTIPNDQTKFAKWLYNIGKSCKEGNGDHCFKNIYTSHWL
jgi:hypothetical protein